MTAIFRSSLSALAERLFGRGSGGPQVPQAPAPPDLPENERQLIAYATKARAQGFNRPVLYLTFDCDTDLDAEAALELDPWLRAKGINAAYAVPGVQLERAADAYRRLRAAGATFLNHGKAPHTLWQDDHYVPSTFYSQMADDEVIADIRQGHATVTAITGEPPRGFRAPHFGSFQSDDQLALIYRLARELGYAYCSTTVPQAALDHGPVIDRGGVFEIPLFGSYFSPTAILDSWTYLEDRKTFRLGQVYLDLFRDTVDYMLSRDLPGVLSFYVDPAHVIGQKPFLDAMDMVARLGIPNVTAEELVALVQAHRGAA